MVENRMADVLQQPAPPETKPSQRDSQGRFLPKNFGGPGNPFARQVAGLRKALIDTVSPEDMADIARKLLDLAKEGNVQAAKLVFSYVLGKPVEMPNPDTLDREEMDGFKAEANMMNESNEVLAKPGPGLPLIIARHGRQATEMQLSKVLSSFLTLPPDMAKEISPSMVNLTPTEAMDLMRNAVRPPSANDENLRHDVSRVSVEPA